MVWFGLFAPARTPKAIVESMNRKTNAVLAVPSVKESFAKLGIEGGRRPPELLAAKVAIGNAEVGEHRARKEHPHRSVIRRASARTGRTPATRRKSACQHPSARCISAYSCSGPATTRPDGARKGAATSSCQLAGDGVDCADRRARKIRPVLHLRWAGDGSRRSSFVPQLASSR